MLASIGKLRNILQKFFDRVTSLKNELSSYEDTGQIWGILSHFVHPIKLCFGGNFDVDVV